MARKADERRLKILMRLVRAGDNGVPTRDLLWEFKRRETAEDSALRTLRSDLAPLKDRGLVRTQRGDRLVHYVGPNGRKPVVCVLTREEHAAIFSARCMLGRESTFPSPTGGATAIDRAFLLVRILEEAGGTLSRREAQTWAGWTWRQFKMAAKVVSEVFAEQGNYAVDLDYADEGGDVSSGLIVSGVTLRLLHRADLRDTGTDTLGIFPYSAVEVEERLDLIAEAMEHLEPDESWRRTLESARTKLRRWQSELAMHERPESLAPTHDVQREEPGGRRY